MPSLVLLKTPDGSATGERIQLDHQPVLIGRSPERCKVVLPLNAVSREHAQIEFMQGQYFITDLESRNKTFINNKVLSPRIPTALNDGDGVKICDFLFCFRDESSNKNKIPLPKDLSSKSGLIEEEVESSNTTVEATLQRVANQQFLDAQPNDKLRALLKISSTLGKSLDVGIVLKLIADELFEVFRQADRCFIIQLNESGHLVPVVSKSRRSAPGEERFSRTIVKKCLEQLQAFLSEDASSDSNIGMAQSIAEFRIRSVMCVPLATPEGVPLGVIQLDSQDRTKKFNQEDLKLLVCVANQASIALDNANLHEQLLHRVKLDEENKAATKVQMALLPQSTPRIPGYEFFARYLPARTVGGDYYDFISLPDGRQSVLVGDVSGKGVPAALIVARVSGEAKVCLLTRPDIADAVTHLNDMFFQANFEDRFLTLAASVLDPKLHRVTIVNAGHVAPWIYRQATRSIEKPVPDSVASWAIGWVPGNRYESITVELQQGDTLMLYTDGILDAEAADGKRFNEDGVLKALKINDPNVVLTAQQIGKRIIEAVLAHAANHPQFDDIALVCFGRIDEEIAPTRTGDSPAS
ncbi:MAG: SpoIIE family protein phosphatase [Planctomycetes bacterium]|nr:SpoIIE family protein phosphatase [Planctomycetota bacterium]